MTWASIRSTTFAGGMLACVKHPARNYCTACFSGHNPSVATGQQVRD